MRQVGLGLLETLDSVVFCGRAHPQAVELWKDLPQPVGALRAAPYFREGLLVVTFLSFHEATQVIRVFGSLRFIGVRHVTRSIIRPLRNTPSALQLQFFFPPAGRLLRNTRSLSR